MRELEPPYDKGSQAGGARCHVSGQLKRACGCHSCRGARNRRSGMRKQREARKALEAVTGQHTAKYAGLTSNEEAWAQPVRVEVKSGAQAGPIATKFLDAARQSEASKAVGDFRPFVFIAMPAGWGKDGIVCCRLSELARVVEALISS